MRGDANPGLERGMAAQLRAFRQAMASGVPRLGWKVAFNAPAVQKHFGLEAPCVGALDGRALRRHPAVWPVRSGAKLHVEAEVAFRLAADVAADATAEQAASAVGAVAPAIEIVDYARPAGDLEAMATHAFFHEATVIGTEQPVERLSEVAAERPMLLVDGHRVASADPLLAMPPVAELVSFVARHLARYGEALMAGDLIIGGALLQPHPVRASRTAVADFGPFGEVRVSLVDPSLGGACGFPPVTAPASRA